MRRDYPARRYLFAGIVDPPGLRAAPQLAASPVHHDATLRLPTIKLTDAEVEGRRRLLLELSFVYVLKKKLGNTSLRSAYSLTYWMNWKRRR